MSAPVLHSINSGEVAIALWLIMRDDPITGGLVDTYKGSPAITTAEVVPEDFPMTSIYVEPPYLMRDNRIKGGLHYEQMGRIYMQVQKSTSNQVMDLFVIRIFNILHRNTDAINARVPTAGTEVYKFELQGPYPDKVTDMIMTRMFEWHALLKWDVAAMAQGAE